jgi:hypothetical protein
MTTTIPPPSERPGPAHPNTIDRVRQWVIMGVGVILVLYSLTDRAAPAALMLGCAMIGGAPLDFLYTDHTARDKGRGP